MKYALHILGAIICIFAAATAAAQTSYTYEDKLIEAFNQIVAQHVDTTDRAELVDLAIAGMISKLDPHTKYWTVQTNPAAKRVLENEYTGFGFDLRMIDDTLTVMRVTCDGPADKAGIMVGDKILSIANRQTSGCRITQNELTELIDSQRIRARFSIVDSQGRNRRMVNIARGKVEQSMVSDAFLLASGVAVIKIDIFGDSTGPEFKRALRKLKRSGAKNLIIDLRDNSGGFVSAVEEIMSVLLPPDTPIFALVNRKGEEQWTHTKATDLAFNGRIVALCNGNSASACELLMAILQDTDRGVVVGRPSFGKGLVQQPINFPDGSALSLSTHRWISPSGRCVQRSYTADKQQYNKLAASIAVNPTVGLPQANASAFATRNGRKVFGDSGITPDIFVELDTLGQDFLLWQLRMRKADEIATTRIVQTQKVSPDRITDQILAQYICAEANRVGIDCTAERILRSPLILSHMRASLHRRRNCDTSILQSTYQYDLDLRQALRCFHDDAAVYEKKISGR